MNSSQIQETWYRETKYQKKKPKKKFKIESRYVGRIAFLGNTWSVWGRYATEKARDTALAALKRENWEYR